MTAKSRRSHDVWNDQSNKPDESRRGDGRSGEKSAQEIDRSRRAVDVDPECSRWLFPECKHVDVPCEVDERSSANKDRDRENCHSLPGRVACRSHHPPECAPHSVGWCVRERDHDDRVCERTDHDTSHTSYKKTTTYDNGDRTTKTEVKTER